MSNINYNFDELKKVQKGLRARLFNEDEVKLLALKFVKNGSYEAKAYKIVPNSYLNSGHTPQSTFIYFKRNDNFEFEVHYSREETEMAYNREDFSLLDSDIVLNFGRKRIIANMSRLYNKKTEVKEEIKEDVKNDKNAEIVEIEENKTTTNTIEKKVLTSKKFQELVEYTKLNNKQELNKNILNDFIENISKEIDIDEIDYITFIVNKHISNYTKN
ncbi:UNVERIFIED_ORG: hypothetical protein B2H93_04865 [Clostridium botulinum]